MADIKPDHKVEDTDNYGMGNNAEPKNMQELTEYVSIGRCIVVTFVITQCCNSLFIFSFFIFRYKHYYKICRANFKQCQIKFLEKISFFKPFLQTCFLK